MFRKERLEKAIAYGVEYSLRNVAVRSGVDKATLSRIERGHKISLENAIRLCDDYGLCLTSVAKHYAVRDRHERLI